MVRISILTEGVGRSYDGWLPAAAAGESRCTDVDVIVPKHDLTPFSENSFRDPFSTSCRIDGMHAQMIPT